MRVESSTLTDVVEAAGDRRTPRQRWRVRYARDATAGALTPREEAEAWTSAVTASALPAVSSGDPPRPRIALGPALPSGADALDEPLDLLLDERLPIAVVWSALDRVLPLGHRIIAIHDVWLGAPALQASAVAVDYRIRTDGIPEQHLRTGAASLLDAKELPRQRVRASRTVRYDLRPLVESIVVDADGEAEEAANRCRIRFRGRLGPDRGVIRPDELLAAIADQVILTTGPIGQIEPVEVVRTRVWLVDDAPPEPFS